MTYHLSPVGNAGAASGGPMELTYIGASKGEDHAGSLTGHADIEAGDLLFLTQWAVVRGSGTPPAANYGTGFTSLETHSGTEIVSKVTFSTRLCLSYKIADGTEASSTVGGLTYSNGEGALLAVYRPSKPITSVVVTSHTEYTENFNPAAVGYDINANTGDATIPHATTVDINFNFDVYWSETPDESHPDGSGDGRGSIFVGPASTDVTITDNEATQGNLAWIGFVTVS